jgi:protein-S-isoprenylcysteine O-methyltransferase Ste14
MSRFLALLFGLLVYVFFLGTFSYAIGFVGNVYVPKSIDSGPAGPISSSLLLDVLLLSAFAVQHSVLARQSFKRRWTRIISWQVERSMFVLAASLVLALLLWQWRPLPQVIWDVRGSAGSLVLKALFWAGWGVLLVSTFLINHFELFGLSQVWAWFRGHEYHHPAFKTPSFYRYVRHPIYLGFVIAFWSAPVMTAGHLLFSIATTGYILLGIYFEERDLAASYGQQYREYQAKVPMLVPFAKSKQENAQPAKRQLT